MNELATYEQLYRALVIAFEYGKVTVRSERIRKAYKSGKRTVWHRVNTPAPDKVPVLYNFVFTPKGFYFCTFIVLDSKDGESFAVYVQSKKEGDKIFIIHAHAIRRFVERSRFDGSIERARLYILDGLHVNDVQHDPTDNSSYIYLDGGIFLCYPAKDDNRILHLGTFIMNRQCSPVQRMKSLTSEQYTRKYKKELGIYR